MIFVIEDKYEKEQIAREILSDLSEWFGLPESTEEYINCSKEMPFWADMESKEARGFIALKETSPYTVDLYVMGVLKEFECFPTLWDKWNPCQIYIMSLK